MSRQLFSFPQHTLSPLAPASDSNSVSSAPWSRTNSTNRSASTGASAPPIPLSLSLSLWLLTLIISRPLSVDSERAQPLHRKKLGLLEKHADYVKRARDFHSKEKRIQTLKEKAAFRNKDEFYHSMVNKKTKNGVHIQSRGNEPLPVDLVKVLKSQDAGYVRTLLTMERSVRPLLYSSRDRSAHDPRARHTEG